MIEAWLLNPADAETREDNPGTRRGRKARRSHRRGRFVKGSAAAKRYMARLRAMQRRHRGGQRGRKKNPYGRGKGKSRFTIARGHLYRSPSTGQFTKGRTSRPLARAPGGGWGGNRGRRSRRRNPDGIAGASTAQIAPFKLPLPGVLGQISNNVVQGVAAGAAFFTGYFTGGAVVDMIASPADALRWAQAGDWRGKWARPLLFGAFSGVIGAGTAWLGKMLRFKNPSLVAAIAAAGPGVRAFGGLMAALLPQGPTETGFFADVKRAAVGLSDYLQIGDYLQLEDDYSEGVGQDEDEGNMEDVIEAGEGEPVAADVAPAVGDMDESDW